MAAQRNIPNNSPSLWRLPALKESDHKYTRGHVLIFGGATMTGASRMAALAAQRSGAGMVTLAVPQKVFPIYAAAMMSVIVHPLANTKDWEWIIAQRKISTILLGPGAEPRELRAPFKAAAKSGLPLILDAGMLALLADDPALLGKLKKANFVCLPHEGEYKKLAQAFGLKMTGTKAARATALAKKLGGIVLFKGAETFIATPQGQVVRNYQKAPWLATAGSGDILAGIVAGLAAQGMSLFDAACAGAYLHGKAAEPHGRGMIAEDVLGTIPVILRQLD